MGVNPRNPKLTWRSHANECSVDGLKASVSGNTMTFKWCLRNKELLCLFKIKSTYLERVLVLVSKDAVGREKDDCYLQITGQ